jgi:PAS domain S-box-containing protein
MIPNDNNSNPHPEEVLKALADSIPQLAWIASVDGRFTWFNEHWQQYTGAAPEQVSGWGWATLVDPEILPQLLIRWEQAINSGTPFEMEHPLRGADGQYRWFLTRMSPVRGRDGIIQHWFGTGTDVDQVKRVEHALREESKVLELLNSTGNALASQRDLRSLLQTVVDAATGISGARFGAFFYTARDSEGRPTDMYVLSGARLEEFDVHGHPRATELFAPTMTRRQVVRSEDITLDARYGLNPPHFGIPKAHPVVRSYMAVPVASRSGEVLGTMFFGHPEPGLFTDRSERIVIGIAAQAAVAIDNTRLFEEARRNAEERKVLLEKERQVRAEAERTSHMKDEFLATLSHELRTPLSAILGWAQVLRRGSRGAADLQKGLETIERNARVQVQLIEDLLDMSRITSGKVLLDMQAVSPAQIADAAIETVRPGAEARGIRIERDYASELPPVAADPGRLQQVIWNLLSNAIKFTPRDGCVTVHIGAGQIAISDNGVGIRAEFLPHVFERFRQADSTTTRRHGGLGLGLSIVKHLVEQQGGTVRADSPGEGKGATFTLHLPLAGDVHHGERNDVRRHPSEKPVPPMQVRDLHRMRVLVVDDEPDARDLIQRILSDCNAEVVTAGSASEALAAFGAHAPDVLVSDLGMPDMDGFELLARVRALGAARGGNVPAVALTAFARSEDQLKALQAGFSTHISKPVEPTELIDAIAAMA